MDFFAHCLMVARDDFNPISICDKQIAKKRRQKLRLLPRIQNLFSAVPFFVYWWSDVGRYSNDFSWQGIFLSHMDRSAMGKQECEQQLSSRDTIISRTNHSFGKFTSLFSFKQKEIWLVVKQMFQSFEENYVVYRRGWFIPKRYHTVNYKEKLVICVAGSNQYVIVKNLNEDWWGYGKMDSNHSLQLPLRFC